MTFEQLCWYTILVLICLGLLFVLVIGGVANLISEVGYEIRKTLEEYKE